MTDLELFCAVLDVCGVEYRRTPDSISDDETVTGQGWGALFNSGEMLAHWPGE